MRLLVLILLCVCGATGCSTQDGPEGPPARPSTAADDVAETCRAVFAGSSPTLWVRAHRAMEPVRRTSSRSGEPVPEVAESLGQVARSAQPDVGELVQRMADAVEAPTRNIVTDFDAASGELRRRCAGYVDR